MLLCEIPLLFSSRAADESLLVCPVCSNSLIVSRTPGDDENPEGQNRMECRTCPYQFLINGSIFERKKMQRKAVDDVMGGKDAWANTDRIESELSSSMA